MAFAIALMKYSEGVLMSKLSFILLHRRVLHWMLGVPSGAVSLAALLTAPIDYRLLFSDGILSVLRPDQMK